MCQVGGREILCIVHLFINLIFIKKVFGHCDNEYIKI